MIVENTSKEKTHKIQKQHNDMKKIADARKAAFMEREYVR